MGVYEFDSQEELDEEFERIEMLNYEYLNLKETVEEKRQELEWAEKDLRDFEEDNKEFF